MRHAAFLILPEFSSLGLAAATEPLFVANWLTRGQAFESRLISPDGDLVRASDGRSVAVDGDLSSVLAAACERGTLSVFVLASFDPHRFVGEAKVVRAVRRLARLGVELIGIENGSLVLAAAGLLERRDVAVHWDNALGFEEHYPRSRVSAQRFVRSGPCVTCAGGAAVLDLMIAWMGWHGEQGLAAEVAEHLLIAAPRSASDAERGDAADGGSLKGAPPTDAAVLAAQRLMRRHVEEPLDCNEIARRTGISIRQLERRFQRELGSTPVQHYQRVRIAKAHQLLQQTTLTVTEVAFACGFTSPEYFSRVYQALIGCPPSRDRRQTTTAPVLRQPAGRLTAPRAAPARRAAGRERGR